jgi:uroporphyrin-3 C-methyltransferase
LAEIEQSLAIATQQLQLAGNVEAALIALREADGRLARAAQPQFLPLRKLISGDIDRLRALPGSDLSGAALKLENVIAAIDQLPFAFEQRPKAAMPAKIGVSAVPGFWKGLLADIWSEIQQLIRIQRVNGPDPGLLAPNQAFFLRENLKLRLVNARLSMLARDGVSFHEDLRQAHGWLEKYFDTQARPVQSALATLKGLGSFDVAQDVPSLNDTLNAVRNFRVPRSRN